MAGLVEKRLTELGISLHSPVSSIANYVGFVRAGNLLVVSGQVCIDPAGKLVATGRLGENVTIEAGQIAARQCALNLCAQLKVALGDLDKVVRVVRLGGFISATHDLRLRHRDERRIRLHGRGVRRQGPPRPLHHRRRLTAAQRRGRGRRHV